MLKLTPSTLRYHSAAARPRLYVAQGADPVSVVAFSYKFSLQEGSCCELFTYRLLVFHFSYSRQKESTMSLSLKILPLFLVTHSLPKESRQLMRFIWAAPISFVRQLHRGSLSSICTGLHPFATRQEVQTLTVTCIQPPAWQDALWLAVPKKKVTRHKKRLKTTVQKRIKLRQDIIRDPRTGEVTLRHKLPFNWTDYLPIVE